MITVNLTGVLAERFGTGYKLDAPSPRDAIRALCSMIDGLTEVVRMNDFNMWVNDRNIGEDEIDYTYGIECSVTLGLHITGAGSNGGIFMVIAGIVLIAFTWWNPYSWAASAQMIAYGIGGAMLMSGASQLLMPSATQPSDEEGNRASYGFNNPTTTTEQGNNVPVIYGKSLIGGFVIMFRIRTEDIADGA